MHTTLEGAKKTAEKQRTSGTKFYIRELPVLMLGSKNNILLVTQINSQSVLENYHPQGARIYREKSETQDCRIDEGSSLHEAYSSFLPNSHYWDVRPPLFNSVIQFVLPRDSIELSPYCAAEPKLHVSSSWGSNYHLGWPAQKDSDRSAHLERVLSWSEKTP
jgi:hypothetical protein